MRGHRAKSKEHRAKSTEQVWGFAVKGRVIADIADSATALHSPSLALD